MGFYRQSIRLLYYYYYYYYYYIQYILQLKISRDLTINTAVNISILCFCDQLDCSRLPSLAETRGWFCLKHKFVFRLRLFHFFYTVNTTGKNPLKIRSYTCHWRNQLGSKYASKQCLVACTPSFSEHICLDLCNVRRCKLTDCKCCICLLVCYISWASVFCYSIRYPPSL